MAYQTYGGRLSLAIAAALATFTAGSGTPVHAVELAIPGMAQESARYIVVFKDAPVANYGGELRAQRGLAAVPRDQRGRLNMRSDEARQYADYVRGRQAEHLAKISQRIGRTIAPRARMQHAINAVVVELTPAEAAEFEQSADVAFVERDRDLPLDTDRGPAFIGADQIWSGAAYGGPGTRGEGTVIGVIDSGINYASPSFAGVGPADGFAHTNPRGAGNYLGTCAAGGLDEGACNDKLIGVYDFVYTTQCTPATPATDPCRPGGTIIEEPGGQDTSGHGTHTASTAAGNRVDGVPYAGGVFNVEGVASRANIISYDACFQPVGGNGSCPISSTTAAANQAVADGVVDAITFSIGGGTSPWTDSTSLAFLGAHNAGIFVSASAGNDGPTPGVIGHLEPWTITSASIQHDVFRAFRADLTGPGTPPANTQDITLAPGGAPQATVPVVNAPLIVSPTFANGANDGCDLAGGAEPYPADFFRRPATPAGVSGIAVIRLDGTPGASQCASGLRRQNALDAGASGVIFVDTTYLSLGASGTSWAMLSSDWANFQTAIAPDPANATISIQAPLTQRTRQGDVMASSSSRGPVPAINLVKPDIAAPGVNILAAYAGAPNSYNSISGTSMATPHNTGAALLLRKLHPTWTPTQIKTALMTTAKTNVLKEDGVTPTHPFDRGAGRTRVDIAARAGLLLDETGANFLAANPATGGKPQNLNLPSIADSACVGSCAYVRTVRNALGRVISYTASIEGVAGAATVAPASFTLSSTGQRALTVTVNSTTLSQTEFTYGELVLTPNDASVPVQRMPIAIRAAGPAISLTSAGSPVTVAAGIVGTQLPEVSTTRTLTITNTGNPTLNWNVSAGTAPVTVYSSGSTNSGQLGGFYNLAPAGIYNAQPFEVSVTPTQITRITANGFTLPSGNLTTTTTQNVMFRIYGSNGPLTLPNGNPVDPTTLPAGPYGNAGTAPVFEHVGTLAAGTGITATGNSPSLDLAAAGIPPVTLNPGRYWLSVTPNLNANATSGQIRWFWRVGTAAAVGVPPVRIGPAFGINAYTTVNAGTTPTFAGTVLGNAACTKPSWASYSVEAGSLAAAGTSNVVVTFNSTGLSPGTYRGPLCITSNDPAVPATLLPLTLNVARPLSAVAAATPASIARGTATVVTATVTPGTFVDSTGLNVRANLAALGGSASQPLFDDGTNGDATPNDRVFSFAVANTNAAQTGNLSMPVNVSDAQGRTATASIALEVLASGNPTGTASVSPSSASAGETVLYTVDTEAGTNPDSTGITVSADFASIGGSATQALYDDGTNGDATAGDGVYSVNATVGAGTSVGTQSLVATIRDAQARSSTASADLEVLQAGAPSATASVAPGQVDLFGSFVVTVEVEGGSNPPSTGITVRVDATSVGGSATQAMYDDGTNGDATAGDGVFSVRLQVPGDVSYGTKTLVATFSDAQGRSGTASTSVDVVDLPDLIFGGAAGSFED